MGRIIYTVSGLMVCLVAICLGVSLCFTPFYFEAFDLHSSILKFFSNEITAEELRRENIQGFHFMPKEIEHFKDVKSWFEALPHVIAVLGACIILSVSQLKMSAEKIFKYALILMGALTTLTTALYMAGYWKSITRTLHPIFFDGNWQFHPYSLIIKLYPASTMQTGMATTFGTAFLLTLGCWLYFYAKERK